MVKVFDLGATGHGFNPRLGPSFKVLQNIGKQFFCKSHLNAVHAYWLDAGATGPLPSCYSSRLVSSVCLQNKRVGGAAYRTHLS